MSGIQFSIICFDPPENRVDRRISPDAQKLWDEMNSTFYFCENVNEIKKIKHYIPDYTHYILICGPEEKGLIPVSAKSWWTIGVCEKKEDFNSWNQVIDMFIFDKEFLMEKIIILLYGRIKTDFKKDEELEEFNKIAKKYYPTFEKRPHGKTMTEYFKLLGVA